MAIREAPMPSDPGTVATLDLMLKAWFEGLTPGQRMTIYGEHAETRDERRKP